MIKITHKNELLDAAKNVIDEEHRQVEQVSRNKAAAKKWRTRYFLATCIIPIITKTA